MEYRWKINLAGTLPDGHTPDLTITPKITNTVWRFSSAVDSESVFDSATSSSFFIVFSIKERLLAVAVALQLHNRQAIECPDKTKLALSRNRYKM